MGLYSWKTADTKKSIKVDKKKVVYLLQPNGEKPIKEECYEGYRKFGLVDAFYWLAKKNLKSEIISDIENLCESKKFDKYRDLGRSLTSGKIFKDIDTNKFYAYDSVLVDAIEEILPMKGDYGCIQVGYSLTANELIDEGIWVKHPASVFLGEVKYPLKFSFNKNAVYEELEKSEACQNQGR